MRKRKRGGMRGEEERTGTSEMMTGETATQREDKRENTTQRGGMRRTLLVGKMTSMTETERGTWTGLKEIESLDQERKPDGQDQETRKSDLRAEIKRGGQRKARVSTNTNTREATRKRSTRKTRNERERTQRLSH